MFVWKFHNLVKQIPLFTLASSAFIHFASLLQNLPIKWDRKRGSKSQLNKAIWIGWLSCSIIKFYIVKVKFMKIHFALLEKFYQMPQSLVKNCYHFIWWKFVQFSLQSGIKIETTASQSNLLTYQNQAFDSFHTQ